LDSSALTPSSLNLLPHFFAFAPILDLFQLNGTDLPTEPTRFATRSVVGNLDFGEDSVEKRRGRGILRRLILETTHDQRAAIEE
jgi:hypothetical protein